MNEFGKTLKRLRTYRNLTQQQLADKLGVDKSTISCYESGKRTPDFEVEEKIADLFNVDLDALRGREPIDYSTVQDNERIKMLLTLARRLPDADLNYLIITAEALLRNRKEV